MDGTHPFKLHKFLFFICPYNFLIGIENQFMLSVYEANIHMDID